MVVMARRHHHYIHFSYWVEGIVLMGLDNNNYSRLFQQYAKFPDNISETI